MNSSVRGAACGVIAAVAYGTNPLFSLNLYAAGMDVESVLFYRFAFAALVLAAAMLLTRHSLAVSRRQLMALVPAGVVFAMSSQTLYQSFLYMDAGVACSILFIYPILVAVIMTLFFHERASLLTYGCIALATAGIAMLYQGDGSGALSTVGLMLVVASSLCYALYIVGVDHSVLRTVPSARMTFWVLASGAAVFFALSGFGARLHPIGADPAVVANVVGVALVPTIIPILFINIAIKDVGPTYSAIIGALEPVTALVIGASVFGEHVTGRIALGALMILVAVTLIVARPLLHRLPLGGRSNV
ncbi:DMT family transporter [Marseilla massiliensis]|uniref:DMT family transporter n=1 Tax=Marseilla massiliensis TaxID=1841864 RepID=UPI0020119D87|nr:EamA family transporter [Marseilla massiliensis]MCL1609322.1 DMT family transporter [Marseilla massiliensis]